MYSFALYCVQISQNEFIKRITGPKYCWCQRKGLFLYAREITHLKQGIIISFHTTSCIRPLTWNYQPLHSFFLDTLLDTHHRPNQIFFTCFSSSPLATTTNSYVLRPVTTPCLSLSYCIRILFLPCLQIKHILGSPDGCSNAYNLYRVCCTSQE